MASSYMGLKKLTEKVSLALGMSKRAAAATIATVVNCLEETLVENLETDGFAVKLNKFGKLTVRHRPASLRKIPLTGNIKLTSEKRKIKFVTLGLLRQKERVKVAQPQAALPQAEAATGATAPQTT